MTTYIDYDVLKDAIKELQEAKELLKNGNCNWRVIQKIEFAMAAIKAKIENSQYYGKGNN